MKSYPRIHTPPPGPRARSIIERDDRIMSQNYAKDYPLVAERAYGAVIEDTDGNLYLDFAAGIAVCATGHSHPDVVKAIKDQADKFLHLCATDFFYENVVALAEGLARRAPGPGPWRVFFANSGAEVVEGAVKLARLKTGRQKIVAFYGGFHGRTYGAMSLTASRPVQRRGYAPFVPEVVHTHYASCYRCPVNREPSTCDVQCLDLPLEPDIITLAKGIASGLPLGAIVAKDEVMQWSNGGHGSTFGGNPVSVAAALATLRLLENGLIDNAAKVGDHLKKRLLERLGDHPRVGDIRGLGLMIGVDLVKDRKTREPDALLRERTLQEAYKRGLLMLGCGKSTLRLAPPLIIDAADADIAVDLLKDSLEAASV